ncbi:methyl-accepting chemotaxis protein [Paenibacillus segetis]|uniref:methyl-accepting chemotaxis protein n=1 Tax=Paenibacillus segetis TaxID=1325360 RepID=UPI0018876F31|nr:methyl-accepting chemotaxis protein [Paenibacillus segetis]
MRKLDSLKVKLTAIFLVLAIIPLAIVTFILLSQFSSTLESQTNGERERMATFEAKSIDDWLTEQIATVEKMLQENPEMSKGNLSYIMPQLKVMTQSAPNIDVISYVDKNGYVTSTQGEEVDGSKFENIIAVQESKKLVISNIVQDDVTKKYKIYFDVPILNEQGEFVGAIQPEIDASKLMNLISGIKTGEKSYGFLLSNDGTYLAHPDSNKIGRSYQDKELSAPEKIEAFQKSVFQHNGGSLAYPEKGEWKEAAFYTIETTGWKLLVTAPQDEVHHTVDKMRENAFIIIFISLICVAILAVFMSLITLRPLLQISNVMRKVTTGDLTQHLKVKGQDEMEQLKQDINNMLASFALMVRKISETTEQVAASSEQLTAIAQESTQTAEQISQSVHFVVQGSDMQVEALGQTNLAMEEMSTGIQKIASSAAVVSESAFVAVEEVDRGNQDIQRAVLQMDQVAKSVEDTAGTIRLLEEKSHAINKTVQLISVVANQTNLLSLNASIEAARAGEHGRGFAVVAGEVKKLAEQTGRATGEISSVINEILQAIDKASSSMNNGIAEVATGVQQVERVGEAFDRITDSIQHVNEQIQEVSAASEQISAGTEEVTASMQEVLGIVKEAATQLNTVSQSVTDQYRSMEEISNSSESLSQMAGELQEMVGKFKV